MASKVPHLREKSLDRLIGVQSGEQTVLEDSSGSSDEYLMTVVEPFDLVEANLDVRVEQLDVLVQNSRLRPQKVVGLLLSTSS